MDEIKDSAMQSLTVMLLMMSKTVWGINVKIGLGVGIMVHLYNRVLARLLKWYYIKVSNDKKDEIGW